MEFSSYVTPMDRDYGKPTADDTSTNDVGIGVQDIWDSPVHVEKGQDVPVQINVTNRGSVEEQIQVDLTFSKKDQEFREERDVINNISDCAIIIQRGIVKQVNKSFANLIGYSIDEIIKKTQDLANKQEELSKKAEESPKSDGEQLAQQQEEIQEDAEALQEALKELGEKMEEFPNMPNEEIQDIAQQPDEQQIPDTVPA